MKDNMHDNTCDCPLCYGDRWDLERTKSRANLIDLLLILSILTTAIVLIFCSTNASAHTNKSVVIAQSYIGKGEIGGDNKGYYVRLFTKGKEVAWCAGFISHVLHAAGRDDLGYLLSAKSYLKAKAVDNPMPGDVVVWHRGKVNQKTGHVGIVETVKKDEITVIEGNVGKYPSKVIRKTYNIKKMPNFIAFVRPT